MAKIKKENKFKVKLSKFSATMKRNRGSVISVLISMIVLTAMLYINAHQSSGFSKVDIKEFEVGMVSDRDIISNRTFEYIDENATEIRSLAAQHAVLPVFYRDSDITANLIKDYSEFINFITDTKTTAKNYNEFKFAVLEKFPTVVKESDLRTIYSSSQVYEMSSVSMNLLKQMLDQGIVETPTEGLQDLNDLEVKILTKTKKEVSYEKVPVLSLIKYEKVQSYLSSTLRVLKKRNIHDGLSILILPFIKPNILFDSEATEKAREEALKKIKPVKVTVEKNQKIIKKGFAITEENYNELKIYASEKSYVDWHQFFGSFIFLILSFIFGLFILSEKIIGENLSFYFRLLILIFFDLIYILVLFTAPLSIFDIPLGVSVILPIAFFAMIISALMSKRVAVFTSIMLALAVFGASSYSIAPSLFALFSGMAGTAFIHITGKRMDLIQTACFLTLIQPVLGIALLFIFSQCSSDAYIIILELAANGFISGIFVLGFLPILESILNTPTSFRLMELSDLNSPMMKKLLVTIPGTYNHSVMVATLAETACRAIGANSLLARVGGYYHDIGKMHQGEYFVENQTGYNKHMEINPRLSATVIRSHVKLGVEMARQMRFPQEVIDIISEHHGNSFIAYFYEKAKELDPTVDREDFSYPGTPPSTKESAVVMLADTVEAACRTLAKPTPSSIEKFIEKLVAGKIEIGMLDNCDLTFKEISIIKETFLTILTGYYHSRIAYPNQNTDDDIEINDPKVAKKLKETAEMHEEDKSESSENKNDEESSQNEAADAKASEDKTKANNVADKNAANKNKSNDTESIKKRNE